MSGRDVDDSGCRTSSHEHSIGLLAVQIQAEYEVMGMAVKAIVSG